MWNSSKYKTFDNIPNFDSTINNGMQDNKFRKVPIFLIENKKDLNAKLSLDNFRKNDLKEKIKKENNNIVLRENLC